MKRLILSTALLVLLVAPFSWGAERIRIGYSSISGSYIGIWVAHDAGLFAREGLEDQIILIPSGSQLAQVTVAGEVEVGSFNGSSAMAAALSGADVKIIGNTVNKMIFSIYARPEIKTVEGLKGKRLGVTRFYRVPTYPQGMPLGSITSNRKRMLPFSRWAQSVLSWAASRAVP